MSIPNNPDSRPSFATWSYNSETNQLALTARHQARLDGSAPYRNSLDLAYEEGIVRTRSGEFTIPGTTICLSDGLLSAAGDLVRTFLRNPKGIYFTGTGQIIKGLDVEETYLPYGMETMTLANAKKLKKLNFPGLPQKTEISFIGSRLPLIVAVNSGLAGPLLQDINDLEKNDLVYLRSTRVPRSLIRILTGRLYNNLHDQPELDSIISLNAAVTAALVDNAERTTVYK